MSCYSHLSFEERTEIHYLHVSGYSLNTIAKRLSRHRSTIGREISRNRLASGGYSPLVAQGRYLQHRQRLCLLEKDADLNKYVIERLSEGWTPEQISGWLKEGFEKGLCAIAFETIYSFIYRASQKTQKLWKYLIRHHYKRKKQRARASRDRIKERQSIHDRPEYVNDRSTFGHWEGDLVICKRSRPLLVIHERKSRISFMTRLANKSADETLHSMLSILNRLQPQARQSVTFDNDMTFAKHHVLAKKLKLQTWFCDAYASWQKGGVENTNGRIRRWLPRHTDLDAVSDNDIEDIIITMNTTPRKCLKFQTPLQAFMKELGTDIKLCFK